jgi:hypothetical protein
MNDKELEVAERLIKWALYYSHDFFGQIFADIHNLKTKHPEVFGELVKEMKARGYKHQSPLKKFKSFKAGKINILENYKDVVFLLYDVIDEFGGGNILEEMKTEALRFSKPLAAKSVAREIIEFLTF